MNLENIMLHEKSQSQKTTYCMTPLQEMSKRGESIETESRLDFQGWEWGGSGQGLGANGYEVSFWGDEYILKLDSG